MAEELIANFVSADAELPQEFPSLAVDMSTCNLVEVVKPKQERLAEARSY